MPKLQLKNLLSQISAFFRTKILPKLSKLPNFFVLFISSWWHVLLIAFAALIFLYYPIGGMLVNNIDTNTNYEIKEDNSNQSATVDMMAYIVNREVNDKMWTPNLPFFFPSYFLDNMPNFQLGMFEVLSSFSNAFASRVEKNIVDNKDDLYLKEAAGLLKYPGTVWMFSPGNKLIPAPSANTQYRKARKSLIKYNQGLNDGSEVFYKNANDLAFFLQKAQKDLWRSATKNIEHSIRENSSDIIDNNADDVFYSNSGKVYAYYLLFKALSNDYKQIIVASNQYGTWTTMLKTLENASQISPMMVRNGELDSFSAPNHLSNLGFYMLKAQSLMQKIADKLTVPNKENIHAN